MKTTFGTSHFESRAAAVRYYADYDNEPTATVERKIDAGEISIGRPVLKPGEHLLINRAEGRYFVRVD